MLERKIIIGLITSTEYCQQVQPIWDAKLLDSATAKRIAMWCWEYYNQYKQAPARNIEDIYYGKVKQGKLPKELAEEFEQDILPNLSEEYNSTTFNVEYLLQQTINYFNTQRLKQISEGVQVLLTTDDVTAAEQLIRSYSPILTPADSLSDHIVTVQQIRRKERKPPKLLMKPWLRAGELTIIYGNYGSGKSLLTIAVAYMLGLPTDVTDEAIGEWLVREPVGTLYIDGELGELEMEERLRCFEWLGRQKHRTRVLSVPEYQLATENPFHLSDRVNQQRIVQWLRHNPDYKVVVLDSVSTLFGLEEENSNSEWNNKVNPFLRDLRALDVACILLHHSGKDNKRGLRGASAMGAMAHNIFRIVTHPNYDIDEGAAWFTIKKDKQRAAGYSFGEFSLRFTRAANKTIWEVTSNKVDSDED